MYYKYFDPFAAMQGDFLFFCDGVVRLSLSKPCRSTIATFTGFPLPSRSL
jgi:hypothetical protein